MEEWARLRRVKDMPYLTRSGLKFVNRGVYLDGTKARDELGWQPKVSIEEGTRLYVQWRRSQKKK
jgi:nucleoside-diphosphate-sugar epimerase